MSNGAEPSYAEKRTERNIKEGNDRQCPFYDNAAIAFDLFLPKDRRLANPKQYENNAMIAKFDSTIHL